MAGLQRRLDAIRKGFEKDAPSEVLAVMHHATAELAKALEAEPGLGVGDRAPDFRLPDQDGNDVGLSDLLKEDPSLSQDTRECAEMINESAYCLLDFVQKTTLLCDLKQGVAVCRKKGCMNDCIRQAVARQSAPNPKKIEFKLDLAGVSIIEADWTLLRIMADYLVDNAVKFSPDRGIISITVRNRKPDYMEIRISDQGPEHAG